MSVAFQEAIKRAVDDRRRLSWNAAELRRPGETLHQAALRLERERAHG